MARLLDYADFVGGPDVITIEMFPRQQRKFTYNFGANVSAYEFSADHQSIVIDQVAYDRSTGDPNFSESQVIGTFANVSQIDPSYITVTNAATGVVEFTIPEQRYTGQLIPNARTKVVATVVTFEWNESSSPTAVKDAHRFLVLERFEPGVPPGDPTLETVENGGYVALTTAG
jgi:hypothetical protein